MNRKILSRKQKSGLFICFFTFMFLLTNYLVILFNSNNNYANTSNDLPIKNQTSFDKVLQKIYQNGSYSCTIAADSYRTLSTKYFSSSYDVNNILVYLYQYPLEANSDEKKALRQLLYEVYKLYAEGQIDMTKDYGNGASWTSVVFSLSSYQTVIQFLKEGKYQFTLDDVNVVVGNERCILGPNLTTPNTTNPSFDITTAFGESSVSYCIFACTQDIELAEKNGLTESLNSIGVNPGQIDTNNSNWYESADNWIVYYNGSNEPLDTWMTNIQAALNKWQDKIDFLLNVVTGIGALTSLLCLIIYAAKIPASAGHPIYRRQCIIGIGVNFLCIAMIGSCRLFAYITIATVLGIY